MTASSPPPPLRKRLKRALRYRAIQATRRLLSWLPLAWLSRVGSAFGGLAYWVVARQWEKARASLVQAFPEWTAVERERVLQASLRHFASAAFEVAAFPRLDARIEEIVEWPEEERAAVERARARGKGVVLSTAHLGHWELLGRRIAPGHQPFFAAAKETLDARLTRDIDTFRRRAGVVTTWRGEQGGARTLLRGLRAGGTVMLLIDQDTRVQSLFVPFFGRLAATPRSAADFAVRTGAPVVAAYCLRQEGTRYRLFSHEVPYETTGDREADALALTAALTRDIEEAIRRAPAQWVWWHERWKTRP